MESRENEIDFLNEVIRHVFEFDEDKSILTDKIRIDIDKSINNMCMCLKDTNNNESG